MKPLTLTADTKKDFDTVMKEQHPVLILFHWSMCGHCVEFMPAWEKVKTTLTRRKNIHVVDVERSHMSLLPENLRNIAGFPTIQVVKNGYIVGEYSGNRTHQNVVDFGMKYVSSASKTKSHAKTATSSTKRKPLKAKKIKSV